MAVSQSYIKNAKFEDFDPNQPDRTEVMWAIYDGSRFRTFNNRGHAINAFHHAYRAKIYEYVNSRWDLRGVKWPGNSDKPPKHCDRCGNPTMRYRVKYNSVTQQRENDYDRPQYNEGKYEFRRQGGKIADPLELLFLCGVCKGVNAHA